MKITFVFEIKTYPIYDSLLLPFYQKLMFKRIRLLWCVHIHNFYLISNFGGKRAIIYHVITVFINWAFFHLLHIYQFLFWTLLQLWVLISLYRFIKMKPDLRKSLSSRKQMEYKCREPHKHRLIHVFFLDTQLSGSNVWKGFLKWIKILDFMAF